MISKLAAAACKSEFPETFSPADFSCDLNCGLDFVVSCKLNGYCNRKVQVLVIRKTSSNFLGQ